MESIKFDVIALWKITHFKLTPNINFKKRQNNLLYPSLFSRTKRTLSVHTDSIVCCVSFCLIKFLCVPWSTSELRVRLVPLNILSPQVFLLTVPRQCFFFWVCYVFAFVMSLLYCRVCSLPGKGLTFLLSCVLRFLVFCHFPIWYPG